MGGGLIEVITGRERWIRHRTIARAALSLGPATTIGAHAAVANAVADALAPLGVKVTASPLGPNDIFELVQAASRAD